MKILITKEKSRECKKRKFLKGEIVEIPNDSNFDVHNGIWRESFCFRDIGASIKVEVVG